MHARPSTDTCRNGAEIHYTPPVVHAYNKQMCQCTADHLSERDRDDDLERDLERDFERERLRDCLLAAARPCFAFSFLSKKVNRALASHPSLQPGSEANSTIQ